jgi:hypothetical protein
MEEKTIETTEVVEEKKESFLKKNGLLLALGAAAVGLLAVMFLGKGELPTEEVFDSDSQDEDDDSDEETDEE